MIKIYLPVLETWFRPDPRRSCMPGVTDLPQLLSLGSRPQELQLKPVYPRACALQEEATPVWPVPPQLEGSPDPPQLEEARNNRDPAQPKTGKITEEKVSLKEEKDSWQNQQRQGNAVNAGSHTHTLTYLSPLPEKVQDGLNSSRSMLAQHVLGMLGKRLRVSGASWGQAVMGALCPAGTHLPVAWRETRGVGINCMVGTNCVGTVGHSYI